MKNKWLFLTIALVLTACTPATPPPPTATAPPTTSVGVIPPEDTATPTAIPPTFTPSALPPTLTEAPSPTETPAVYPPEGYGPFNFPEGVNPLTGLPLADPAILNRRPVVVKISNGPRGIRPQWGLSLADHVFEYYQEVGRTRFSAVFYGQDAEIAGPIRSARFADEDIVRMYKAVFAFGSADARVLTRLFSTEMSNRFATVSDVLCPPSVEYPLCRTDPEGYNHLVTNTALLSEHFTQAGVPNGRQYLDGLHFEMKPPPGGEAGTSVTTRFSIGFYNRWVYDYNVNRYVRYDDTADDPNGNDEQFAPSSDRLTDQPIMADNVVILLAAHSYYSRTPEIWQIKLAGYGEALLFRDGQVYNVSWARIGDQELIALTYPDGSRFPLKPGNVWFEVVGTSSQISNDRGDWRVVHVTP